MNTVTYYAYPLYECVCVLQAVLAAIVLEALWTLFKQFKDIVKYFKLSKPDMVSQWGWTWLWWWW